MNFLHLWSWNGTMGRGKYALIGFIGVALKHNIDRLIAYWFHQHWNNWSFWLPLGQIASFHDITETQKYYLLSLFFTAIPFIWIGLASTLKRLRDAGQPLWLIVLFFAPFVNLIFFVVLCVLPGETDALAANSNLPEQEINPFWPKSALGSGALAVLLSAGIGIAGAFFSITVLGTYGWTMFFALPFVMGYLAVWVHTRTQPRNFLDVLAVISWCVVLCGAGLVAIAIEGLMCMIMAAPIAWVLALAGGCVAYTIHNKQKEPYGDTYALGVVLLSLPFLFGVEHVAPPPVPRFQVRTSIEITAPPDVVWKRIISFPALPPPTEWPFRYAGVAYPIDARISGEGLTADRECRFSTGSFKEPILAWEPGKHFAFGIADEPLLMTETSPYGQIHVRHLDDHDFQPERADFVLVPLPNGRTRLEGTTTYRNKMWPGMYWRIWTDAIVHNIHRRVFEHVKMLAESDVR